MTVAEYMGKDVFEEKIKSNLDRCLSGEIVNYQEWFEYPIKGKRFVDVTYFPYRNGKNHISGVIANTRDITEKKKVEDALIRERKMMARTEAVAHVGSWEWEAEGDKVTWSEELFRIFGLEPMEEAPSFTEHQAYYVPEDRIRLVEAVEKCLRTSVPYDLEVSLTRTDGYLRHCVVRGFPEYGDNGVVNRLYGSLHDITDRKQAKEALGESENQINSIFRSAPVGIGSVVNRVLGKVNNRLCEITGYDERELIGQCSRMLYPSDEDFEYVGREKYAQIADHGTGTVETRWQKKDGTIIDVLLSSTPVDLQDQSKGVTFTVLNITERKQAEMALKESEERFRTLMENIDAVAVQGYGPDGTTQYWNKASERLYGYSRQEAIGRNLLDLIIPSEMRDAVAKEIRKMAESGQPTPSGELLLRHKDGSSVPVISHHAIVKLPGRAQELFCLDVDITERKQAEVEREKLREQFIQAHKMESVGRLAGGVAHDFNNMLGVILGHTELALLQTDEEHDLYSDLKEIQTAATRSADITKQLLAFARKQTISPRSINLNETAENMLNLLRRLIGEDIELAWKPSPNLWPVKMDSSQIDQVLVNLCVNARDAIRGVGKVVIETGNTTVDNAFCKDHPYFIPGDFVMMSVNDDGCGMDEETMKNMFEPFFTTKEVGKGTGLGLATIYGIVKQNNGFIDVYSEPGRGSTFKIYFPRLVTDENADMVVPEKKATARGTETILLVEDEPTILRMTRMMLESKGYAVLSAATPTEAMGKAKNHPGAIDLLMTDVVMPEMNGRGLAEKLSTLYSDINILFMSGYTADVIAHQGILDDGVAFIQKPFSLADMTEKVREVLDMAPDKS